jgi:hypothetical protein
VSRKLSREYTEHSILEIEGNEGALGALKL